MVLLWAIQYRDSTPLIVGSGEWRKALRALTAKGQLMFYNNEILFMAVELKYCERCGSLYVRRSDSEAKFCLPCIAAERSDVRRLCFSGAAEGSMSGTGQGQ